MKSFPLIMIAVVVGAAGLSLFLTGLLSRYALARSLMDVPNERSSHKLPIPRGGGLAIVLSFVLALPLLRAAELIDGPTVVILLGAASWVAFIGFLDDRRHMPARWRLLAHFSGAIWALVWLGRLPPLPVLGIAADLGWFAQPLAAVYLVWLLNLYNFMDGIDGLAGVETITVCFGGALLYWLAVPTGTTWVEPLLLLAAVSGFLFWNFPPAKIFMGDAGSGFVGLTLGILSLQAAQIVPALFWAWVILLGVFIVDATTTLVRRVRRGEKSYEAHRSHAYQYAARKLGSHKKVTLIVGAINLIWLLPVAVLVGLDYLDGLVGVVVAYGPLVWLAFRFKAGARELQEA